MKRPKNNKKLIRVTQVLSFVNSAWKEFWWRKVGFAEADRVGRESAAFGTEVHAIVERYLRAGEIQQVEDELVNELAALLISWIKREGIQPLYIEAELEDKKLGLIGHTDLIADIDGEPVIVDWKTSKKHGREFPLQMAAYAKMANKKYGLNITRAIAVRVDKVKREVDPKEYRNIIKNYWPLFLGALKIFKHFTMRESDAKRSAEAPEIGPINDTGAGEVS